MEKHESQLDYTKGFGGKFGVQSDRQDATAVGFDEGTGHVGTVYEKDKPVVLGIVLKLYKFLSVYNLKSFNFIEKGKASLLKSRFENLAEENKNSAKVILL